jgi:hypothetical protein
MAADFTTFQDSPLTVAGSIQAGFSTPNVDGTKNANLAFRVNPDVPVSGTVTLKVEINGIEILEQVFDTEPQRVWQENFSASALSSGGVNTLKLTKTGGNGDVTVSDFIVHYKTA